MVRSRSEARSATSAIPFVSGLGEGRLARKTCAGCLAALLFLGIELLAANALCPVTGREADPGVQLFHEGKAVSFCCKECLGQYRDEHQNRLSPEEKKAGWKLLFNGRNVEGFQPPTRDSLWMVKDGVLTGTRGPGVLGSIATFSDFTFRADARVFDTGEKRGNSGVFFRSSGLLAFRGRWPDGFEAQIDHGDANYWTGALFKKAKAKKVGTKDKEWFQIQIEAKGEEIRVWINGELVTRFKTDEEPRKGPISFQVHSPAGQVEFKNMKVLAADKP